MKANTINTLRFYSRELIREFGFLNDYSKWADLNHAQIHLLLECERHGTVEQQELADSLRVDKSYVNRSIKALIALGYVSFSEARENGKNKPISLTDLGLIKVKEINDDANQQVFSALNYLTAEQHITAYEGIKLYSGALKKARTLATIVIRPIEKHDNQQLCLLIKSVLSEFGANKPGFAYTDEETNSMYEFYQEKNNQYYVAYKGTKLLGGIGFAPLKGEQADICELRKMYLCSETRGMGLGYELLRVAMNDAKNNYQSMYLETLSRMTQAISLYQNAGFEFLAQPMGNTGHYSCDTWMIKAL